MKSSIVLACAVVVAGAAAVFHDMGDTVLGDANGDDCVDVRDLQTIVAKVLQSTAQQHIRDFNGDGRVDVLDFQRAVALVQGGQRHATAPRAKNIAKACFFRHQNGSVFEVAARRTETTGAVVLPPVAPLPLECFYRSAIFPAPERYLFRMTPNAPPVFA